MRKLRDGSLNTMISFSNSGNNPGAFSHRTMFGYLHYLAEASTSRVGRRLEEEVRRELPMMRKEGGSRYRGERRESAGGSGYVD